MTQTTLQQYTLSPPLANPTALSELLSRRLTSLNKVPTSVAEWRLNFSPALT